MDVPSEDVLAVVSQPHICVILDDMKPNRPGLSAPQRVSAALLRDELTNSAAAVRQAELSLSDARTERDAIIREASSLVPMLTLARLTGLSRDRIHKIVNSGDPHTVLASLATPTPDSSTDLTARHSSEEQPPTGV